MRIFAGITGLAVCCSALFAAEATTETEAVVKALQKHVSVGSVNKSSIRNDQNQKFEIVKVVTSQDEDSPFVGTMRFTFELVSKAGDVFYGQIFTKQRPHPATNYTGEDEWEFEIPDGDLKFPKLEAYAVEFGFETNKVFVPVAQKLFKVESGDEIAARNKDPQKKLKIKAKTKPVRASGEAGGE